MSEPTARAWRFYLDDMIGCAEKVLAYTADLFPALLVQLRELRARSA